MGRRPMELARQSTKYYIVDGASEQFVQVLTLFKLGAKVVSLNVQMTHKTSLLPAELTLTAPAENSHVNALNHPHSMRMIHRFQRHNAM